MSIRLSKNFILSEFTTSQTAARRGIDNMPSRAIITNLQRVAFGLESVRKEVVNGSPIIITSGYRSPRLNAAIGGSKTSDHQYGFVSDFTCPSFGTPRDLFEAIKNSGLSYDQLILEFGQWVHMSFAPRLRQESLVAEIVNKKTQYRYAA